MSIFKETFPKYVRDQLKVREQIIARGAGKKDVTGTVTSQNSFDNRTGANTWSETFFNFDDGDRENDFFVYSLTKQCTLRLSSGVDITDRNTLIGLEITDVTSLGLSPQQLAADGVVASDAGSEFFNLTDKPSSFVASKFVLEGGIKKDDGTGRSGIKLDKGAYGDVSTYSDSHEFDGTSDKGIVPMPGILNADIKTKSA